MRGNLQHYNTGWNDAVNAARDVLTREESTERYQQRINEALAIVAVRDGGLSDYHKGVQSALETIATGRVPRRKRN